MSNIARVQFLKQCLDNRLIPRFLPFKVPSDGTFNDKAVHSFQLKLLRNELSRASKSKIHHEAELKNCLSLPVNSFPDAMLLSSSNFTRKDGREFFHKLKHKHEKKLLELSHAQERLLRSVNRTVVCEEDVDLPNVVKNLSSFGPKLPVMTKFVSKGFLADMEDLVCSL